MGMEVILFGVFVFLLVVNVPIGVALGLSGIAALVFGDMPTPPLVVAQRMFTAVDSFPFMAIPFFMIAGGFMVFSSAMILYETSNIIHGGERNYIMATVSLYLAIYNLFISLLQILSIFSNRE